METVTGTATSVYRYFDATGQLLYVGVTARGVTRSHEHARSKEWWPLVASAKVKHYETRRTALAEEARLIRLYRPPYNTAGKPDGDPRKALAPEQLRGALGRTSRFTTIHEVDLDHLVGPDEHLRDAISAALRAGRAREETVAEFRRRLQDLTADC